MNDEIRLVALEKFAFTPYYRQYFFSKEDYGSKGFYGEVFLKFYTYKRGILTGGVIDLGGTLDPTTYFETAIGVGIGWKWVSDSGFLIDINGGLGRNLGISDDPNAFDITGRFGVNFGWRF